VKSASRGIALLPLFAERSPNRSVVAEQTIGDAPRDGTGRVRHRSRNSRRRSPRTHPHAYERRLRELLSIASNVLNPVEDALAIEVRHFLEVHEDRHAESAASA
jgi:hypothetical protein